ncbi:UNVERIFIED_CONTAM: Thaumatin-like protein [Sesamum latifolium]|uniref:Thaumatin-like protein n=1 Tax=Sesamum latifolium TaxID=2727402 RepID=A0AAW2YE24_9LAMI
MQVNKLNSSFLCHTSAAAASLFSTEEPEASSSFLGGLRYNNDAVQQMQPPCLARHPTQRWEAGSCQGRVQAAAKPVLHPPTLRLGGRAACGAATAAHLTPRAAAVAPPDFYDVSLVDGYNLAISITPFRGKGKCSYAGCVSDLNMMCPVGLQVRSHDKKSVVACKSACFAFNSPDTAVPGASATHSRASPQHIPGFSKPPAPRLTRTHMTIRPASPLAQAAATCSPSALTVSSFASSLFWDLIHYLN